MIRRLKTHTSQSISGSLTAKMWKIGLKNSQNGKNANISVRGISKFGFAQITSSPTFFNIFAWNFQDMRKSASKWGRIFDLRLWKNLAAKFWQMRHDWIHRTSPLAMFWLKKHAYEKSYFCPSFEFRSKFISSPCCDFQEASLDLSRHCLCS